MNRRRVRWNAVLVVVLTTVVVLSGLSAVGGPAVGREHSATQTASYTTSPPERVSGNATNTTAQTGETAWPMAGANAANTRHLDTTGPTEPMNVRWQFKTKDEHFTHPVVANGTLYFGGIDESCTPDPKGKRNPDCREHIEHVYAVGAETGEERWRLSLGDASINTPAVVDSTLYVPSNDLLLALDAETGTVRWRSTLRGTTSSFPVLVDGTVYLTTRLVTDPRDVPDSIVYALDASTGEPRWTFRTGNTSSPPAVADGTVYIGTSTGWVYALDAETGTQQWTVQRGTHLSFPTVANGLVYVGTRTLDDTVYALDAQTGDIRWNKHIESEARRGISGSPSVAGDTVYFGADRRMLFAVDAKTGTERWSTTQATKTPVLANGLAYASDGRTIYALDVTTGIERARFTVDNRDGRLKSGSTVLDGSLYVNYGFGENDTRMYAIGTPAFSYSNLSISPHAVAPGEPVTVTATVTNTGTAPGTFNATLVVNGSVVSAGEASLDAGGQTTVEFTHVFREKGTYSIGVDELSQTITATTVPAASPTPMTPTATATTDSSGQATSPTAPQDMTSTEVSTHGFAIAGGVLAFLVVVVGLLRRTKWWT